MIDDASVKNIDEESRVNLNTHYHTTYTAKTQNKSVINQRKSSNERTETALIIRLCSREKSALRAKVQ